MTPSKILDVAEFYLSKLKQAGVEPERNDLPLERAAWCAERIPELIKDEKVDKAHVWLGFIQGVLFTKNVFTVDELREHNRTA